MYVWYALLLLCVVDCAVLSMSRLMPDVGNPKSWKTRLFRIRDIEREMKKKHRAGAVCVCACSYRRVAAGTKRRPLRTSRSHLLLPSKGGAFPVGVRQ